MDMSSSTPWLLEFGMENPNLIHQFEMDSLDEFTSKHMAAAAVGEDFLLSFSSESDSSSQCFIPTSNCTTSFTSMETPQIIIAERPMKQQRHTISTTQDISNLETSPSNILSFDGKSNLSTKPQTSHNKLPNSMNHEDEAVSSGDLNFSCDVFASEGSKNVNIDHALTKASQGTKRNRSIPNTKSPSYSQDHIVAERKRREKLNDRFIALSAILPGLKKMDKASVLGEAIRHMKQLQERVTTLEEQSTTKKVVEAVMIVEKSQLSIEDDNYSSDGNIITNSHKKLPEIEARVSDNNVLIRIHCEKQKGVLGKTLDEIEKLNLTVINTSVMSFGNLGLDMTIVAQMENGFNIASKDIVSSLRSTL